ncbi:MAG: cytochrome P450 [Nannocystaceae bacterium]
MSEAKQPRPPAPPSLPGHFLFGNAQEFYADRLRFLQHVAQTHGDVVRYRLGCEWYYLVNDPREARDILRDWEHIDNATSDGGFQLDHSFIAKNGKERVIPRSISHSSICPRAVSSMHGRIVEAVQRMFSDWEDGQERDVLLDMMKMNVEVVSVVLFGRRAESWLSPVLHVLTDLQMLIGAYTTSEQTRDRMHVQRRRKIFDQVEGMVERLLAEITTEDEVPSLKIFRRAHADGKLSEREVIHEMCVLLLSVSSTAVAAMWTWLCLSRNPRVWDALETELDTLPSGPIAAADLERLSYLPAVLKEVLRLMPPLGVLHRKIEHDWDRGSYVLPASEHLHVSPYLLHRHPAHWHDPEQFRPERFDPQSPWHHPDQDVAYMPFAVGVRHCIGETLAWHQLQVMVATIARRFRPEVAAEHELPYDVSPLGSLHPVALTMPVRLRERRRAAPLHSPSSAPAAGAEARDRSPA